MSEDLEALRKVAEAATPGPWSAERYMYGVEDGRIRVTSPSDSDIHNLAEEVAKEDAEFIATFDPPTVLALLTRVEQAEQAVARVRELADHWIGRVQGPDHWVQLLDMWDELLRALDGEPNE